MDQDCLQLRIDVFAIHAVDFYVSQTLDTHQIEDQSVPET